MKLYLKYFIIIVCLLFVFVVGFTLYNYYRIKNAKIKVTLIDNLDVEVFSNVRINDFIKKINGKIIKNRKIDTTKVGKQIVEFKYINDENIKVSYSFEINVVDLTPPLISYKKDINVYAGNDIDLIEQFFCGDNYDNKPKCEIDGEYDLNTIGDYNLVFKASDKSNNESINEFTLHVIEKSVDSIKNNLESNFTYFDDVKQLYKTKSTKIGIDVSKWQGDIDFDKIKSAGVEFVFIRVGTQKGKDGKYVLDEKFKRNIEGFNKVDIPVGIYFFSYADSIDETRKQAKWVLKQIKKYKIDLPIVFDWENWSSFSDYDLSFYSLTKMSNVFASEIKKKGYNGMLYSSKYYLENVWINPISDVWLAHYTDKTDYEGNYKFWQMCDDGKIDGIKGSVDIDIFYK